MYAKIVFGKLKIIHGFLLLLPHQNLIVLLLLLHPHHLTTPPIPPIPEHLYHHPQP
jgi:hypothetical protein